MLVLSLKEAKEMCDSNYNFFTSNIDNLCQAHENKYVVIKNQGVIGVYDSFKEAYTETIKKEELGTFLIQLCSKDEAKTVNCFYSNNVVFA